MSSVERIGLKGAEASGQLSQQCKSIVLLYKFPGKPLANVSSSSGANQQNQVLHILGFDKTKQQIATVLDCIRPLQSSSWHT